MRFTLAQIARRAHSSIDKLPAPLNPSWEQEREALARFASETGRVIMAIFAARRFSRELTFYIPDYIGNTYGVDGRAISKALKKLDGSLIQLLDPRPGYYWTMRLMPEWENPEALEKDPLRIIREAMEERMNLEDELETYD